MIDVFCSRPHYLDHLLPVVLGLGDDARLLVTTEELWRGAREAGVERVERGVPRRPGPPTLVAGYMDANWTSSARRLALLEHGVGQTYTDVEHKGYAGGPDWERLSLALVPGPWAREQWEKGWPGLRAVEVGVPKLDRWHGWMRWPASDPPSIAFTFHWQCTQTVETWPAFDDWADQIAALARTGEHRLLGHWHPRWGDRLARWYTARGIELAPRFEDVLRGADLLVADNTSALYEFAALDRPVLCLNEHRWRRDVDHGLRFWDRAPGLQAWPGESIADTVADALADPAEHQEARRLAMAAAYGDTMDGQATKRAVDTLREWAA